ncbi:MAG: hypothetical protein AAF662_10100 [Pseudomonadota bacterium]
MKHSIDEWPPTLPEFRRWAYGLQSSARAKSQASEDFDRNPLIDGTSKWDADRESYERRAERKRAYIAACANEVERSSEQAALPSSASDILEQTLITVNRP